MLLGELAEGLKRKMAKEFSKEGFVKALPSDQVKASLDRRRYKPEQCAEYGGIRGYVIGTIINKSPKAASAENPEGLFTDLVWRITAPCPVVDSKDNVERAEIGEDVLVAATHQLKKLVELANDERYCVEATMIPLRKEKSASSGHMLWHMDLSFNPNRQDKAKIVPEVGLLLSFKEGAKAPLLADGTEAF